MANDLPFVRKLVQELSKANVELLALDDNTWANLAYGDRRNLLHSRAAAVDSFAEAAMLADLVLDIKAAAGAVLVV